MAEGDEVLSSQKAAAFAEDEEQAVAKYPDLAPTLASVIAIKRKVEADGLPQAQRDYVMRRVRALAVRAIEAGHQPSLRVVEPLNCCRKDRDIER